ncbi:FecR family protein [Chitinophaga solisilvae]|uniref:FecR family protein n=1 Tax=Chitinophaga solisilvae TaxID=1233460 RepID=UPI00136F8B1A|nr:FecR domain-containing protein [Chitinophaga solisilvae]
MNDMREQYKHFDKQDFLEDDSFISWVKGTSVAATALWTAYIAGAPANIAALRVAEQALRLILSAERILPPQGMEDTIWHSIQAGVQLAGQRRARIRRLRVIGVSAAAVLLLMIISTGIWLFTGNRTVSTGYGETTRLLLADQSRVILNANSALTWARRWPRGESREVWLRGEAYFEVNHLKQDQQPVRNGERFIVHTAGLDVEVLGTAFNVKARRGFTTVGLSAGRVKIHLPGKAGEMQLLPGQSAVYNEQTGILQKQEADITAISAWKENKLMMNNTSVGEIIQVLEDTYGYRVILEDTTVIHKRIQGTIPVKNEDNIIFILSGILKVNIEKKGNQLLFRQGN